MPTPPTPPPNTALTSRHGRATPTVEMVVGGEGFDPCSCCRRRSRDGVATGSDGSTEIRGSPGHRGLREFSSSSSELSSSESSSSESSPSGCHRVWARVLIIIATAGPTRTVVDLAPGQREHGPGGESALQISSCLVHQLCGLHKYPLQGSSKHAIKCTRARLDLLHRKKQAMVKFIKKDVADLLINALEIHAFGWMDGLIV